MPRSATHRAVLAGSSDDVESAFYEALQAGDLERLMACWAEDDDIVCVHPGGIRLLGHGAIRSSFAELLAAGGMAIQPAEVARVLALASAVHSVHERVLVQLEGAVRETIVQATNVYHRSAQGWRIVAHHASVATVRVQGSVAADKTLH